jgi:hypothetical protein
LIVLAPRQRFAAPAGTFHKGTSKIANSNGRCAFQFFNADQPARQADDGAARLKGGKRTHVDA